jgi:branched-chain amino acid aminotransferase
MAKIEANNANADEAIFLNPQGYVCEGTAENIFIVQGGRILTPPTVTGALPGITQAAVSVIAEKMGIPVEARPFTPHELFSADEIFFSGTAAEIIPVVEVNGRMIGAGKPGALTNRVWEEFSRYVSDPANGRKIA